MRTYLVVVDDSPEAALALRFAGRRAAGTGGGVHLVAVIEPQDFVAWGGVQATIAEEARQKAEAFANDASDRLASQFGITPRVTLREGEAAQVVRDILVEEQDIAALVLGTAASGAPGPLVAEFTGYDCGTLSVPVMLIPGSLTGDEVDRLT